MGEDERHAPVLGRPREQAIAETFVTLADSLVADYDLVEVLQGLVVACVDLLGAGAAGMLLDDQAGGLVVVAATDDETRLLEAFQVQHAQGPCRDCVRSGEVVFSADLEDDRSVWPEFAPVALRAGHRAVLAVPLRLRGEVVGALGMFRASAGQFADRDRRLAQAFADVATIGILQSRTMLRKSMIAEQLRAALDSRVVIEQAKGVLAERLGVDMAAAFAELRSHARNHNLKLTDVARAVVDGDLAVADV